MPSPDAFLTSPWMALVVLILIVAGLAHGTMGFGFPLISTPMIAMVTDIRTAVLVSLVPNIAVNLVSTVRGGNWSASLAKYWPVAVWVLLGTFIGTKVLILADPEPLKLLLAFMIVVYLLQGRLRGIDWSWLARNPRKSAAAFGTLAGFLSGAVNVALPPLVIYFMALGLDALAMTQILNLCFLAGRSLQAITLGLSGHFGWSMFVATMPLTLISLAALFAGMKIQQRIRPQVFQGLLRKVLWVMAAILAVQVVRHYVS
jgi:uncharacterized membrane protein YfcA